jgi:hypothetical protein
MRHLRFHTERDVHSRSFPLQFVQPDMTGPWCLALSPSDPSSADSLYTGLATALGAGVSMAFSEGCPTPAT